MVVFHLLLHVVEACGVRFDGGRNGQGGVCGVGVRDVEVGKDGRLGYLHLHVHHELRTLARHQARLLQPPLVAR